MSMTVQAVGTNAYSAPQMQRANCNDKKDASFTGAQEAPKKEKHVGKAIASALFPGLPLGQFFDGRFGSGFKHMLGFVGLGIASKVLAIAGMASKSKIGGIAGIVAGTLAGIGAFATYVHSIVDAYNGGKKA